MGQTALFILRSMQNKYTVRPKRGIFIFETNVLKLNIGLEKVNVISCFFLALPPDSSGKQSYTFMLITYCMEQSSFSVTSRSQLVKKFPAFYRTRRFIAAITRVHHVSVSRPYFYRVTYFYGHLLDTTSCRSVYVLMWLFSWLPTGNAVGGGKWQTVIVRKNHDPVFWKRGIIVVWMGCWVGVRLIGTVFVLGTETFLFATASLATCGQS
jgi:hypothetical protein